MYQDQDDRLGAIEVTHAGIVRTLGFMSDRLDGYHEDIRELSAILTNFIANDRLNSKSVAEALRDRIAKLEQLHDELDRTVSESVAMRLVNLEADTQRAGIEVLAMLKDLARENAALSSLVANLTEHQIETATRVAKLEEAS